MIHVPSLPDLRWHQIHTGLSGARVWRGELDGAPVAVRKRYPTTMTLPKLQAMHTVLATARQSLGGFVPTVLPTAHGEFMHHDGTHIGDVQTWITGTPGTADDVVTGLRFIRSWHAVFALQAILMTPAPGLAARVQVLKELNTPEARTVLRELLPWQTVTRRCHVIHGDSHREHLLFQDGNVAGLIDFAATRIDDPLMDVARWLGDVGSPSDVGFWGEDEALLNVLVRASVLCAVWHWRNKPSHPRAVQLRESWTRWMS
jgi:hypothetical protein